MRASDLLSQPLSPWPEPSPGLEEAAADDPRDWPQATAFALARAAGGEGERRPVAMVTTAAWRAERGGLSAQGLAGLGIAPDRVILVRADKEAEALWAMEEVLKSGAVAGAVGTVRAAPFTTTRRLDFAARQGRAAGVLLRVQGGGDLSAARLRWRIGVEPSLPHPFDPKAPGLARMRAELTRRRDGPLGAWMLEQDDDAHRLRLAAGLADHGLVAVRRTDLAA